MILNHNLMEVFTRRTKRLNKSVLQRYSLRGKFAKKKENCASSFKTRNFLVDLVFIRLVSILQGVLVASL